MYRTELEGFYLGTKTAEVIDKTSNVWNYWTDSMASMSQCSKQHMSKKDMVATKADILLAKINELRKNEKKGNFHHVKGHQDEEMKFSSLSREAKYNVLCDEQATKALSNKDPTKLSY